MYGNRKLLIFNVHYIRYRYNGIKDLATLQLGRLPSLKALFLQGKASHILHFDMNV